MGYPQDRQSEYNSYYTLIDFIMLKELDLTHAVRFTDFVLSGYKRPVFIKNNLNLDVVIQKHYVIFFTLSIYVVFRLLDIINRSKQSNIIRKMIDYNN